MTIEQRAPRQTAQPRGLESSGVAPLVAAPDDPGASWSPASLGGLPGDSLVAGEVLLPGQRLGHQGGAVSALMRSAGNFVAFRDGDREPLWQSGTAGYLDASVAVCDDGEVVVWAISEPVWAAGTGGHPGAFLQLHSDGRLVVYDFFRDPLWSSSGQ